MLAYPAISHQPSIHPKPGFTPELLKAQDPMGPVFWDFMNADQKLGGSKNVDVFFWFPFPQKTTGEKTTKKDLDSLVVFGDELCWFQGV